MIKALFQDSFAGYLIVATIVGATAVVVVWALIWKKKISEEQAGS
jgi:hypothetical protein